MKKFYEAKYGAAFILKEKQTTRIPTKIMYKENGYKIVVPVDLYLEKTVKTFLTYIGIPTAIWGVYTILKKLEKR